MVVYACTLTLGGVVLQFEQLEQYVPRYLVYSILWSFSGDGKMKSRIEMGDFIRGVTTIPLPVNTSVPVIDHEVRWGGVSLRHMV